MFLVGAYFQVLGALKVLTSAPVFHPLPMLCDFAFEGDATALADLLKGRPAFIVVADPDYTLGLRYGIMLRMVNGGSMAEQSARVERPVSPHLQIYRLTFTFLSRRSRNQRGYAIVVAGAATWRGDNAGGAC